MQIVFAAPFVAVSLALGVLCLAVPGWRPHFAAAVVSPIAFGVCGITGMILTILAADAMGVSGAIGMNEPWDSSSWGAKLMLGIIFLVPGVVGGLIAGGTAGRVQRWWSAHRQT